MVDSVNISYKKMAKLLGVSVSDVRKIHNSLITKGYIRTLKDDATFQLTVPDKDIAAQMHYGSFIKYTS